MKKATTQERLDTIAKRLSEAMVRRGMNAAELSHSSGVGQSDISNYLKAKYAPRQDKIYALAKALDVNIPWLWAVDVVDPDTKGFHPGATDILRDSIIRKELSVIEKAMNKMSNEERERMFVILRATFPDKFD